MRPNEDNSLNWIVERLEAMLTRDSLTDVQILIRELLSDIE
jgi:hypothetical protein